MGKVNTSFTERVRYTLYHDQYGSKIIQDPEGWESDEKEIARNEEYHGIFAQFSNSLKFTGSGRDFIKIVRDIYGINAEIRLTKDIVHPQTDLWVKEYDGYLDMSTYSFEDNEVSIKFNSGGIEQLLNTRESDDVELDRETTMDGKVIPPLVPNEMYLEGRKIFLQSKWEVYPENNQVRIRFGGLSGGMNYSVSVPLSLTQKSHEEAQDISPTTITIDGNGEVGNFDMAESLENRTLRRRGKIKFLIYHVDCDQSVVQFSLSITKYTAAPYYIAFPQVTLYTIPLSTYIQGQTVEIAFDETINILRGESLSLDFNLLGVAYPSEHPQIILKNIICDQIQEEDSFFEPSTSKVVLIHDVLERLSNIITNQSKVFYSEYFGRTDLGYAKNGTGAFVGITHGFWIRKFDKLPLSTRTDPNPFKPITTSFKDAMESLSAIFNVGLGIEKRGYNERIVVEDMSEFYKQAVTIKLPFQVNKVKRSEAIKYYCNSIQIGYEKGGEYEEATGLFEYNAKSTYTTVITRLKQPFTRLSKWRADSAGKEFARRKPKYRWGTLDTTYDNDIFINDLKPGLPLPQINEQETPQGNNQNNTNQHQRVIYYERKWRDDLTQAPAGTYSPETATNLRLSPFNMMLRHGWVIASGLTKYITDYVRYASSTANSNLKTWLRTDAPYLLDTSATPGNGNEYSENGNIINSELKRPRYLPEYVEFEHSVTFDIMEQVEGTTVIGGKSVYNKYGLVEFLNEDNEIEKGFLMNLKPNDGKWKLLKFNS